jgi:hypothetical protein
VAFRRPHERILHQFAPRWEAQAGEDNVLVFDMCRWRIGEGRWSKLVPVFRANRQFEKQRGKRLGVRFEFSSRLSVACPVAFATENLEQLHIEMNGDVVRSAGEEGHFLDAACRRSEVSAHLRPGRNVIEITGKTGQASLEHAYLLGPFSVHREAPGLFGISDAPRALGQSGWQASGYPFYAGPMTYRQQFAIRTPRAQVICQVADLSQAAEVFVNGRLAGRLLWRPFEVDITPFLRRGANELGLRIYGSLRNTLGPWHLPGNREIVGYGRDQFEDGAGWMDEYDFVPMGLLGRVRLVTR